MLAKVRPDIRIFTSAMIDDFASGKACVALGWAGDFNIAKARAVENKNGEDLQVLLPKTGGLIFFDNLAITKDAKHPNNAHAFIDYFLRPDVSAALTNELGYPLPTKPAWKKSRLKQLKTQLFSHQQPTWQPWCRRLPLTMQVVNHFLRFTHRSKRASKP